MHCYWKVQVWDESNLPSPWSELAFWTVGLLKISDWEASWIHIDEDSCQINTSALPIPCYLRKDFLLTEKLSRATTYVTAAGVYEFHLNDQKVGNHLLAPEWTNYHKRMQYDDFDVTALLSQGTNTVGAVLGNGWYCGLWQCWPPRIGIYGEQPHLLMQLEIEYADGRSQRIVSDQSWHGTTNGPIRFSCIYEGESYDARLETPGWDKPGFETTQGSCLSMPCRSSALLPLRFQPNTDVSLAAASISSCVLEQIPVVERLLFECE